MKIYTTLAPYYDALLSHKPYQKEVEFIQEHMDVSKGKLLDVTCATGRHIEYFKKNFSCIGIDISSEMVAIAKERNPDQAFLVGDMKNNATRKQHDVVCSLYNSVGFLACKEELEQTIRVMSEQTKQNGYVVIETNTTNFPYFVHKQCSGKFNGKRIEQHLHSHRNSTTIETATIIFDENGVLENIVEERHKLLQFSREEIFAFMKDQQLTVNRYTNPYLGSDLFFGKKR